MSNATGKNCGSRIASSRNRTRGRQFSAPLEEPYATRLKNTLRFHDLDSAEASLRNLDAAYQSYRQSSDRVGASLVRALVLKGKQRAQNLAANPRVSPAKRQEKQEIVRWFTVWLQTPDLFFDWLELRKRSEEFQRRSSDPAGE